MIKEPHAMIDLETLGINQDALICTIGTVLFDPNIGYVDTNNVFDINIDWQSSLDSGRKIEVSALRWWLTQSDKSRNKLVDATSAVILTTGLELLHSWLPKNAYVWSNGSTFDISILENAYKTILYTNPPWNYNKVRDFRTIEHLAENLKLKTKPLNKNEHIALEDAKYQAACVCEMWQYLKR